MKTFTMNLDFLNHRPSVDHVKMPKFLVLHGIRIFIIFCGVELPIRRSTMEGQAWCLPSWLCMTDLHVEIVFCLLMTFSGEKV